MYDPFNGKKDIEHGESKVYWRSRIKRIKEDYLKNFKVCDDFS